MRLTDENLTQLWTRTRASFARVGARVGAPAAIAALVVLARGQRREISVWLTKLESIVRKLLFAEASRLPVEPIVKLPLKSKQAASAQASTTTRAFDPSNPESWSARFKFAPPRDPRAVPEKNAPRIRATWDDAPPLWGDTHASPTLETITPQPDVRVCHPEARDHRTSAKHFAIRFEAIRRVLADPMPFARRLARIFRRLCRRFPEAPQKFWTTSPRGYIYDPHDPRLDGNAMCVANEASYAFDSS